MEHTHSSSRLLTVPVRTALLTLAISSLSASGVRRATAVNKEDCPVSITRTLNSKPNSPCDSAQLIEKLSDGKSISRTIGGGERQSYDMNLAEGDLVRFVLEKGDLNLNVVILGPDGKKISDIQPQRTRESFSILTSSSGVYNLAVQSNEKAGYTGSYELRSDPARKAAARDGIAVLAERSFQQADHLRAAWRAQSFGDAITKYQEARGYWRRAGDAGGEALAVLGEADVLFELSENRKAANAFTVALALSEKAR
ncbi:MAG TPA: hypothetical protein VJX67_14965, partial [Blastocatellia bacterium]|nr:hypothetical protein [Blastocatellia bacterium]